MIVEGIWNLLRGAMETVLGWLPEATVPDLSGMVASLQPLWGYLGWANKYAPVVEAGAMLALLATVYVVMFLFNLTVWVLTKVHVLGGQ